MKPTEYVRAKARAAYLVRAWLVAVAPSLVYFFTRASIGAGSSQAPAGALDLAIVGYGALVSPLLETALVLLLASPLGLLAQRSERARIILLATTFAPAHLHGGGRRQVVATPGPSIVYFVTLIAWLKRSTREAFALTALVHALYNLTFFAVGALGTLIASPDP